MAEKQGVSFEIELDTSQAEQSIKDIQQLIPRSLEKMIKKFEELEAKIARADGASKSRQKKAADDFTAEIKNSTKDLVKTIKATNAAQKALEKTKTFQGYRSKTKRSYWRHKTLSNCFG